MKTKEAIEFLKGIKHSGNGYGNSYISDFNGLKGIISLLEQVEKYENIWEELYGIASEFNFFPLMDKLKLKNFPKE